MTRLPIWLRAEETPQRQRLNREKIAAAALVIADQQGFEAVSMRRIAKKLGTGTMSLYHYVQTKEDLVALMDDALMGEVVLAPDELPKGWREALTAIARRTRQVFERHPWALSTMSGAPFGPNAMRHFEQCLTVLGDVPLSRSEKLELLGIVDDLVFGHVLRAAEARGRSRVTAAERAAMMDYGRRQLETGRFPATAALWAEMQTPGERKRLERALMDPSARFERGLKALLDEAQGRLETKRPRRRAAERVRRA